MNRAIEIHDSTFAGTSKSKSGIVIHLNKAYIHESEGDPGIDNGKGFIQAIDLELKNAVIESTPSHYPIELSNGHVSINGKVTENCVSLPINEEGEIEISFLTTQNEWFKVRGTQLISTPIGMAEFIEEFKA